MSGKDLTSESVSDSSLLGSFEAKSFSAVKIEFGAFNWCVLIEAEIAAGGALFATGGCGPFIPKRKNQMVRLLGRKLYYRKNRISTEKNVQEAAQDQTTLRATRFVSYVENRKTEVLNIFHGQKQAAWRSGIACDARLRHS